MRLIHTQSYAGSFHRYRGPPPRFLRGAEFFYVYDGDGNIVRSIDISSKKEYNYEYEEGRIVRATEADIELSGEIVISKVIVNTIKYYYDTEGKMTKKVITPASGSAQTIYYETNDDNTVVKFSAGGRTVTSHSKTDSFGRKVFDELQLGTDFVSRQFVYYVGKVTPEHKTNVKVKSSNTSHVKDMKLGDYTLSYCGCEVLAIYNAMIPYGMPVELPDLIFWVERSGAVVLKGKFGTNPYAIDTVLKYMEVPYTYFDSVNKMNECFIINHIGFSAHYT